MIDRFPDDIDEALVDATHAVGRALAVGKDGHAVEFVDGHALREVARGDVGNDADIDGEGEAVMLGGAGENFQT